MKLQDVRQTSQYASFMRKLGWEINRVGQTYVFIKKILFFNVVKILRSTKSVDTEKIRKKYHPLRLIIQPLKFNGKPHPSPLVPTKTIWIDLQKSEDQLLKEMKQKTRYNLKLAQKNNLKIKIIPGNKITSADLKAFYELWKKNKPFDWLFKPSSHELESLVKSFSDKCFFVLTTYAGLLILQSDNMAFYWHNCSNFEAKKLFAPTLLIWEAIRESKERNLKIFDFEGIWDERIPKINTGWKGFTRFKQGFGGAPIYLA